MKLLFISANWCKHCIEVAPIIEKIGKNHPTEILKVTQENRKEIKEKYMIPCIPALVIIKDDLIVDTWHADMDHSLEDFLKKYNLT